MISQSTIDDIKEHLSETALGGDQNFENILEDFKTYTNEVFEKLEGMPEELKGFICNVGFLMFVQGVLAVADPISKINSNYKYPESTP